MTAPKTNPMEKAIAKGAVGQMGLPNRVLIDNEGTNVEGHNARQTPKEIFWHSAISAGFGRVIGRGRDLKLG